MSALVIGGTGKIRAGRATAFLKVVAAAPAVVTRKGQVQAEGRPCAHATLGPLEDWLDAQGGAAVIDGIAARAVLDGRFVKGERERLLTAAFMVRVLVLMTLMPDARLGDVIAALAGDLALVPWSKRWRLASDDLNKLPIRRGRLLGLMVGLHGLRTTGYARLVDHATPGCDEHQGRGSLALSRHPK